MSVTPTIRSISGSIQSGRMVLVQIANSPSATTTEAWPKA